MQFDILIDEEFVISEPLFDNSQLIEQRLAAAPAEKRTQLGHLLRYLYQKTDGRTNLEKGVIKTVEDLISPAESILVRWLQTRTNGSERKNYGAKSLIAARNAHYRCEKCGFPDIRVLQLDHVDGRRSSETDFMCLCANCHQIKSRKRDWLRLNLKT